ncbi:unnamed protein product [Haemonchus placei]|uniref:Uncharacterized protein n=1 Tax=Haemonchus placei TaxID=6290 RepID=A0A0N4X6Y1_HAEPC|nr:unnamed protein product [Haemonchus placei]
MNNLAHNFAYKFDKSKGYSNSLHPFLMISNNRSDQIAKDKITSATNAPQHFRDSAAVIEVRIAANGFLSILSYIPLLCIRPSSELLDEVQPDTQRIKQHCFSLASIGTLWWTRYCFPWQIGSGEGYDSGGGVPSETQFNEKQFF